MFQREHPEPAWIAGEGCQLVTGARVEYPASGPHLPQDGPEGVKWVDPK
jgi:hypothetical protein